MARIRAPELLGQGGWIGATDSFGLAALSGKVVVLDFFTTSCINCIRVEAELAELEERFTDELVVVGIHSPKFPREHEHDAVERAIERLRITHPVLDDPDLATWQQYGVRGWPTAVLIDPEGYVVGGVSGEGCGAVLASSIEQVIAEHSARGSLSRAPAIGIWSTLGASAGFKALAFPAGVAVEGRRVAISDTANNRVVIADLQGRVEQIHPLLHSPRGLLLQTDRVVVCDTGADRVVAIDRASGEQTVLAEGIASPWDVDASDDGTLYVAEAGRHRLWAIAPGQAPTVIAGTGQENLVDSGPDQPALLAQPSGVAVTSEGAVVFVDAESSSLRVLEDGKVRTLIGQGIWDWGASDGDASTAAMQHPTGVAAAPGGAVYIADTLNNMVRSWDGNKLRTLPVAGLEEPHSVALLPDGRLLIADTNHHRVVIVGADEVEPRPVPLDESWLGTAAGAALQGSPRAELRVPYAADVEGFELDATGGPAVRVELTAEPATLLGAGPRAWSLEDASGSVAAVCGSSGEGVVVVSVEVSVCRDDQCTVLRTRTRHDTTIIGSE